jgi:hypothetical protein
LTVHSRCTKKTSRNKFKGLLQCYIPIISATEEAETGLRFKACPKLSRLYLKKNRRTREYDSSA